jgi:hypothetical protein
MRREGRFPASWSRTRRRGGIQQLPHSLLQHRQAVLDDFPHDDLIQRSVAVNQNVPESHDLNFGGDFRRDL